MNCLIVDDEKLAQDILEGYIEKTPGLRLSGRCNNALEAISALHTGNIDLMFLDIKMPEITGADLLKLLKNPPAVIMTTAFSEYALDGYEWNILDYLLKPIPYERFLKAVYKVEARMQPLIPSLQEHQNEEIFVKSDGRLVRVLPREILFIEGLKNYLIIHTSAAKIIIHSTFISIEESLAPYNTFIRIHKSYLVNKDFISHIAGNLLYLSTEQQLPVGAVYRQELMQSLKIIGSQPGTKNG